MTNKVNNNEYLLGRDYAENTRLNVQHYLTRESFGFLVHPSIPTSGENLRIADVGSGTGRWLLDLSRQLHPSTQFDGLDLELTQPPPKEWCPENVSFRQWDIKTSPPEDLVGKYDIVALRYLLLVVQDHEIDSVMQNVLKLLKPGGWLQWMEPDNTTVQTMTLQPKTGSSSTEKLVEKVTGAGVDYFNKWSSKLVECFEKAGLVECDRIVDKIKPDVTYSLHEGNFLLMEQLVRKVFKTEEDRNEGQALLNEAVKEARSGFMMVIKRVMAVGKKPA